MKMACLLVHIANLQFWLLCSGCERSNRGVTRVEQDYRFFNFDYDQFPESFGQTCFTCRNILKDGSQDLFDTYERHCLLEDLWQMRSNTGQ